MDHKKQEKPTEDLVIDQITHEYMRTSGTHRSQLSKKIQQMYQCHSTHIVSSGMNAIYLVFMAIQKYYRKGIYLFADEVYSDTGTKIKDFITDNKNTVITFDQSDFEGTKRLVDQLDLDNVACVFFESCSNPSGKLMNWDIIQRNNLCCC